MKIPLSLLLLGALLNDAASSASAAPASSAAELVPESSERDAGGNLRRVPSPRSRRAASPPSPADDGRPLLPGLLASVVLPTGPGGCSGTQEAVLDVYPGPMGAASPAVLVLPGGAYMTLQGGIVESVGPQYLEAGYALAVLWYRLPRSATSQSWLVCGEDPWEAIDDVAAAVAHLRDNAAAYHADVDEIVLAGFSAGGHLAALYSATCAARGSCPRGQVLHFPFLEKGAKIFCSEAGTAFDQLGEEEYRACLPTALADGATPPTIVYHAAADPLVSAEEVADVVEALDGRGTPHERYEAEGGGHYLVPFDQVAAVSDGALDPSGTYADLVGRALSLPIPGCVRCDDVPTTWMAENGKACATAGWHVERKCADDPAWAAGGHCRATCHAAGRGYGDEVCCPPPGEDDCVACSDEPTPWMASNGVACHESSAILTKCRDNPWWTSNNICQQSCFDAGRGYDGNSCCDAVA